MKFSINIALGLLGGILLTGFSPASWATLTWTLSTGVQTEVVSLSPPVISAGVDVPVGTVLYQAQVIPKDMYAVIKWQQSDVGKTLFYATAANISNTPHPLANLPVGIYTDGVYQTGIPGIGVAIVGSGGIPFTEAPRFAENQNLLKSELAGGISGVGAASTKYVVLIRTGPITPGNYPISGADFPTLRQGLEGSQSSHANAVTTVGLPIYHWYISFRGNITVSAQTCITPDVPVALGSYDISKHFTRKDSTTPWVDASITLTNCPTFSGFYNSTNAPLLMDYNTGEGISTTSLNNSIGVRLTPTSNVIDAAKGVMAIDSTLPNAASGVGIQLGWGSSSQTPMLFDFNTEKIVTLPKDGSPLIRIPLAARYIQTADFPTPGKANGKVTFNINYY